MASSVMHVSQLQIAAMRSISSGVVLMILMVFPVSTLGLFTPSPPPPPPFCPEAFWVFGDSLADTGNTFATFPFNNLTVLNPPYGKSFEFTDKPGRNRYSNGRLIIDFIAQAFNFNFFGSYAHVLNGANYMYGANFAYAGAEAESDQTFFTPFTLQSEINNFQAVKDYVNSIPTYNEGPETPNPNAFSQGAYIIPEIGGDDFQAALLQQKTPAQIIADVIPGTLAAVRNAVIELHAKGARLFFLFNIPPQGCNALNLAIFSGPPPYDVTDALGCLTAINEIDQNYNAQLNSTLIQLQQQKPYSSDGTKIYLFDWYNATEQIFSNKAQYGFTNILAACCGYGPPYNYNPYVTCGNNGTVPPGSANFVNINTACSLPNTYAQWDGDHFTEAFYREIATMFLNGEYVSPPLNLTSSCFLELFFIQFYQTRGNGKLFSNLLS